MAPKNWRELRKRDSIIVSASQFETANLCLRKWWLEKVRKLPVPSSTAQIFGDCLHGVVERYLQAPPNEQGMELYPPGWHITKNRFTGEPSGETSPDEQALIKKLVRKAIDEGIIHREPDGMVERAFRRRMTDHKGVMVSVQGFVDYDIPGEIQDHKTSKNTRYLKTKKSLPKALPMLLYGYEHALFRFADQGKKIPATIRLRHNQFVKDPDKLIVRKVSVPVTFDDLQVQWNSCIETAKKMVSVRKKAEKWSDCPDPVSPRDACNAYGGCPFMKICHGSDSEYTYKKRLEKGQLKPYTSSVGNSGQASNTEGKPMSSLKEKLAARAAAKNGGGQTPPAEDAATVNPPAEETTQEKNPSTGYVHEGDTPPWADDDCDACEGGGFNTKGNACRICDNTAKENGRPTSKDYEKGTDDDGNLTWTLIGGKGETGKKPALSAKADVQASESEANEPAPAPAEAPAATKPKGSLADRLKKGKAAAAAAPAETPAADPPAETTTPATDVDTPTEDVVKDTTTKAPGRPKKGFMLLINCAPVKGIQNKKNTGRAVYYLDEVLHKYGEAMAKDNNVESFYDIDGFARRDALAKVAGLMAAEFGADLVVAAPRTAELRTLTEALRPYAGMIIEAVGVL